MTTLIKKLMGPIDALRECMALFRAGFHLEEGHWALDDRLFYSRQAAAEHMRSVMVRHAIERSLQK